MCVLTGCCNAQDIPLEVILVDPTHRKTLRQYAESLFCDESLLFWERVLEFRRSVAHEPATASALARNIWKNFLAPSAEKQLILRNGVADAITSSIDANALSIHTFDAAQVRQPLCFLCGCLCFYMAVCVSCKHTRYPTRAQN